jgi:hypothetical protein
MEMLVTAVDFLLRVAFALSRSLSFSFSFSFSSPTRCWTRSVARKEKAVDSEERGGEAIASMPVGPADGDDMNIDSEASDDSACGDTGCDAGVVDAEDCTADDAVDIGDSAGEDAADGPPPPPNDGV